MGQLCFKKGYINIGKKMGGCSALNCSNQSQYGVRLFRFPADPIRRSSWIANCRRGEDWTPNNNSRLCQMHFEEDQYEQRRADGKKKLRPNAIPTIFAFSDAQQKPTRHRRTRRNHVVDQPGDSQNLDCGTVSLCEHSYHRPDDQEDRNENRSTGRSANQITVAVLTESVCCQHEERIRKLEQELERLREQVFVLKRKLQYSPLAKRKSRRLHSTVKSNFSV
ncbi:52 kDa repressor of the inhibitor of the protein kinase isoform X1 [Latimeria chalumnae]|uniref:52 kDa repressor of the inhibitor of the protein kinase isoform X1 n=2 Tax=Latimeria chalumnae TaxID=7897 RepID=UPI0003C18DF4|nr:PREDICTED: 52 kDa repressor of the inhibitor of the protein kinase-like isoform X2 [Latimeria chalumnae]|eukprot:XP_005986332.1 PREDICTED: 52 kDa repressor of the inhibitor of the protein kinase-like isoform X2 [Latimeria chalumnae]